MVCSEEQFLKASASIFVVCNGSTMRFSFSHEASMALPTTLVCVKWPSAYALPPSAICAPDRSMSDSCPAVALPSLSHPAMSRSVRRSSPFKIPAIDKVVNLYLSSPTSSVSCPASFIIDVDVVTKETASPTSSPFLFAAKGRML